MPAHGRGGKVSRMLVRRSGFGLVLVGACTVALAVWGPSNVLAAEVAQPAAGGAPAAGELPPVVVGGGGGAPPANDPDAPAPGAQPAAPAAAGELPQVDVAAADPVDVAADAAIPQIEVAADEVVAPIEVEATPQVAVPMPTPKAPAPVVDGGGTSPGATTAPEGTSPYRGGGELPFTGATENLLLALLAAILVLDRRAAVQRGPKRRAACSSQAAGAATLPVGGSRAPRPERRAAPAARAARLRLERAGAVRPACSGYRR